MDAAVGFPAHRDECDEGEGEADEKDCGLIAPVSPENFHRDSENHIHNSHCCYGRGERAAADTQREPNQDCQAEQSLGAGVANHTDCSEEVDISPFIKCRQTVDFLNGILPDFVEVERDGYSGEDDPRE